LSASTVPAIPRAGRAKWGRIGPQRDRLLFLYLPFLFALLLTFATTPDDAFIPLRYAANLIHGHGATFNPGERVQGFTSPLGLSVAVLASLIPGGLALLKMKLASVVFGVMTLHESASLIDRATTVRWIIRAAYITLGSCSLLAFASGDGLETTLEAWLLIALAGRLADDVRRRQFSAGAYAFLAVLAQPDALLVVAFMALADLVAGRSPTDVKRVKWFAGALIAAVASAIGQWVYFGSALPSTYYAKHLPLARSLHLGVSYLSGLLQPVVFAHRRGVSSLPIDVVAAIEALLFVLGTVEILRKRRALTPLVAIALAQATFILWSGGDTFVGGRFLAPAAAPFVIVEAMGVVWLERANRVRSKSPPSHLLAILSTSLIVVTSLVPLTYEHAPVTRIRGLSDRSLLASSTEYTVRSVWLDLPALVSCLRPGALVATTEIGFLGFERLDIRILDLRGLTNMTIARTTPAQMKGLGGVDDLDWWKPTSSVGRVILARHPAAVVEFDSVPSANVLAGRYRLVRTRTLGVEKVGVYAPTSAQPSCLAT
jgi:hypothetical protein